MVFETFKRGIQGQETFWRRRLEHAQEKFPEHQNDGAVVQVLYQKYMELHDKVGTKKIIVQNALDQYAGSGSVSKKTIPDARAEMAAVMASSVGTLQKTKSSYKGMGRAKEAAVQEVMEHGRGAGMMEGGIPTAPVTEGMGKVKVDTLKMLECLNTAIKEAGKTEWRSDSNLLGMLRQLEGYLPKDAGKEVAKAIADSVDPGQHAEARSRNSNGG